MGRRHGRGRLVKALVILLAAASGAQASECSEGAVQMRGAFGAAAFDVAVADDPRERAKGLMFVEQLAPMEGMLFVYERPQPASFWMRNTLIPLDMLFAAEDGTVTHIHENAIPHDETPIPGGDAVRYVLELNGGTASRLGLSVGDEMRHPSIGPAPVWPCE